jgi:phosphoribosylformylglycinamidine synthase PurS subunit
MKTYRADITILPKDGVLDIQGKAVEKTLAAHGYDAVLEVRVGKFIRVSIEAAGADDAGRHVRTIAEDLLVNDLVESYTFIVEEMP